VFSAKSLLYIDLTSLKHSAKLMDYAFLSVSVLRGPGSAFFFRLGSNSD
jgi:hypothetical protein